MNEKEQRIAEAIKEMASDANVDVKLNDGTCTVNVKTTAKLHPGDIVPIIGRIAGLRTRAIVNINK